MGPTESRKMRPQMARRAPGVVLLAAMTLALASCSSGNGPGSLAEGEPASRGSLGKVASPTQVVYKFERDSSGKHPGPTSTILLGFEGNGQAYIYAFSAKSTLAYHGQWSYSSGQMSLAFNASDLKFNVRFPMRLSDTQVTMPFQVLSEGKGQSYWQASWLPLESGIFAVYLAARADDSLGVTGPDAVKRAVAYAQSQVQLQSAHDFPPAIESGRPSLFAWASKSYGFFSPVAYADTNCRGTKAEQEEEVKEATIEGDMIHLVFCSGPDEMLYMGYVDPDGHPLPLSTTALTGDPRVFINPKAPGDSSSDPTSKTAIIISPYTEPAAGEVDDYQDQRMDTGWVASRQYLADIEDYVSKQNYSLDVLVNKDANLRNIVSRLLAMRNPGILDWEGHGAKGDELFTSDHSQPFTGTKTTHPELSAWYDGYLNNLKSNGLGDLVSFDHTPGTGLKSATIFLAALPVGGDPRKVRGYIVIQPDFWKWMVQKKGLDLSRSLAFINACDSADTPELARALEARAFFGWKYESSFDLSSQAGRYLYESLSRPTHSAEESYYNMLRVARTRRMIYKEDRLFKDVISPAGGGDTSDLFDDLRAYGWNGSELIDYAKAGWSGTNGMNPGQVWWLLFAERWSQDSQVGADNLKNCYNEVWGSGHLGNAFKYMFCHNANTGSVPTRNEVAYAIYLLTGKDELGFSGTKVPRWTLDDGR